MIRLALVPLVLIVVLLVVYCGSQMFASQETRIRWLLQEAVTSFNNTSLSGCMEAFDQDYKDKTISYLGRPELANALRDAFLRRVDPKTKAFLYRVRVPEQGITIKVAASGEQAEAEFTFYLDQRRDGAFEPQWQLIVTAQLRKVDGNWRIHEASHVTVEGDRPR